MSGGLASGLSTFTTASHREDLPLGNGDLVNLHALVVGATGRETGEPLRSVAMPSLAELVALHIERWDTSSVEQAVFRTTQAEVVADRLEAFAGRPSAPPWVRHSSTSRQQDVSQGWRSTMGGGWLSRPINHNGGARSFQRSVEFKHDSPQPDSRALVQFSDRGQRDPLSPPSRS